MYYSVYTAAEVAAAANLPGGAASVRQIQPVVPQSAKDVQEGIAYFVADVSREWPSLALGWRPLVCGRLQRLALTRTKAKILAVALDGKILSHHRMRTAHSLHDSKPTFSLPACEAAHAVPHTAFRSSAVQPSPPPSLPRRPTPSLPPAPPNSTCRPPAPRAAVSPSSPWRTLGPFGGMQLASTGCPPHTCWPPCCPGGRQPPSPLMRA